ncbi:LutC/YkgG family protein [Anseongella ginsenosidimutans]|nr:lactate utilization protein [Anseongella ginsenosidimutans]
MLKKIRKALIEKRENPYPEIEPTSLYPDPEDSLDIVFAEELTRVNGEFLYCEDQIQLIENLLSLSSQKKWRHIYCWENKLQSLLRNYEFPFRSDDKDFEQAEVGITLCEALIARNGSVLVSSAQNSGRRLSVYPHAHIVIAYSSQLVADLKDGFGLLKEKYGEKIPSYTGVITGPSRTADIEKTLVLGAHGPRELYVFLLEE